MSHTLGIVGHISRGDMIDRLSEQVRPDVVSIDDGTLGCEDNHRQVWSTLASDYPLSRWTVVLEDDALPVQDFDIQLEAALRFAPTSVVSLYLGRLRPVECQPHIHALVATCTTDPHWLVARRLLHGVGLAIRTPLVPRMLDHVRQSSCPIDQAISNWAAATGLPVSYTWPSLVDHADEQPMIATRDDRAPRAPGRVAWRTGTRDTWCSRATRLALP